MRTSNGSPQSCASQLLMTWGALYDQCTRSARGLGGIPRHLEDCIQEVFEELLQKPELLPSENRLAYVKMAIKNRILKKFKDEQALIFLAAPEENFADIEEDSSDGEMTEEDAADLLFEFVGMLEMDEVTFQYLFAQTVLFHLGKKTDFTKSMPTKKAQLLGSRWARRKASELLNQPQPLLDYKLKKILGEPKLSYRQSGQCCEFFERHRIRPQMLYTALSKCQYFLHNERIAGMVAEACRKVIESLRQLYFPANQALGTSDPSRQNRYDKSLAHFAAFIDEIYTYAWIPRDYMILGTMAYLYKEERIAASNHLEFLDYQRNEEFLLKIATDRNRHGFDRFMATAIISAMYTTGRYDVGDEHAYTRLSKIEFFSDPSPLMQGALVFSWVNALGRPSDNPYILNKVVKRLQPDRWYAGLAVMPNPLTTPYMHLGKEAVKKSLEGSPAWLYVLEALSHPSAMTSIGALIFLSHIAHCEPPANLQAEYRDALNKLSTTPSKVVQQWLHSLPSKSWNPISSKNIN